MSSLILSMGAAEVLHTAAETPPIMKSMANELLLLLFSMSACVCTKVVELKPPRWRECKECTCLTEVLGVIYLYINFFCASSMNAAQSIYIGYQR